MCPVTTSWSQSGPRIPDNGSGTDETTLAAIREFDVEIEKLCATHPDFPLFQSLPGAGEVTLHDC